MNSFAPQSSVAVAVPVGKRAVPRADHVPAQEWLRSVEAAQQAQGPSSVGENGVPEPMSRPPSTALRERPAHGPRSSERAEAAGANEGERLNPADRFEDEAQSQCQPQAAAPKAGDHSSSAATQVEQGRRVEEIGDILAMAPPVTQGSMGMSPWVMGSERLLHTLPAVGVEPTMLDSTHADLAVHWHPGEAPARPGIEPASSQMPLGMRDDLHAVMPEMGGQAMHGGEGSPQTSFANTRGTLPQVSVWPGAMVLQEYAKQMLWHEGADGSVFVAVRLAGQDRAGSQQISEALADALRQVGVPRTEIYVNGRRNQGGVESPVSQGEEHDG